MHNNNHRETWREFGKRIDPHVSFTQRWPGRGTGRYWKRQLSKARRKVGQSIINYQMGWTDRVRMGSFPDKSRECNWKTW